MILDDLKELRSLTGNADGAQRVAFTPVWQSARAFLAQKLSGLPVESFTDPAGNFWATLPGESGPALLLGGHMDSVPNGGWLDGCLNTLASVHVLRRLAELFQGRPPVTIRLVDWADEEGSRFGKSLFGSSACAGTLRIEEARPLRDRDGISLPEALAGCGLDFEMISQSRQELESAAAYLELHIEQGPVLLNRQETLAAVVGTFGVERHAVTFRGQAAHSGSTPMDCRHDAFAAAARMGTEIYKIAAAEGGVCTIGSCQTWPGIVTSVVETCEITLDQRHIDPHALARMLKTARSAANRFAEEAGVSVAWRPLCQEPPASFHPDLIRLCEEAIRETCGTCHQMPSGPLHDATSMARAGIPTTMMFVQSLHGISHNKIEDTREEHILLAVEAFERLARKTIDWIVRPATR